jgi:DNA-directed RNA polymerase subunit RPC12/RpoP
MEQNKYKCAECESEVTIKDGEPVRTCEHADTTIILDMEVVVYGESSFR